METKQTKPGYKKYRIHDHHDFLEKTGIRTEGEYVWIKNTDRARTGRGYRACYTIEWDGFGFDSDWFKDPDLFGDVADKLDLI